WGVLQLDRDPGRADLEVMALRVHAEVRVEVPQHARMGDLLALVTPGAVPVDAEGPGRQPERAGARRRAHSPSSSKATLANVTTPSGSGHWPYRRRRPRPAGSGARAAGSGEKARARRPPPCTAT